MHGELLTLPIYRKSYKQYYEEADKKWTKTLKSWEDTWSCTGVSLSEKRKTLPQEICYAPPWQHSDIIGYVQVRWDLGVHVTGYIFLKLKYIPKDHHKRKCGATCGGTIMGNNQIFYFEEILKVYIENKKDNGSIIDSINSIVKSGQSMLKNINKNWIVQSFPFTLDSIDFVKVFKQLTR